jgi:hypothetical protein
VAGFREFVTGEVLTAANVNQFLMEQATMTFADDAARTAALAGVLREGLLTYNLDTARLEVYDGTAWVEPAPEPPAGIGSNVVQTVKADTFTTTSGTFTTLTGLTVSITPSSATSKILIVANFTLTNTNNGEGAHSRLVRNSTPIYLGTAVESRIGSSYSTTGIASSRAQDSTTLFFLDSPELSSSITYGVEIRRGGAGTAVVGRSAVDDDQQNTGRSASSITAIEVEA